MMTRIIFMALLLHAAAIVNGQLDLRNFLTPRQVTDLRSSLNKNIEDTTRIDILLRLAKYHFEKEGDEKQDLDSAAALIANAKEINAKQIVGKRGGAILLHEASYARISGNTVLGRQLVNEAIRQLQTSNDEFNVAQAYLEFSRCYNPNEPQQTVGIKNVFNALFQRVPKLISHQQQDSCMAELTKFYVLQMTNDSYLVKLDFLDHLFRSYQILNDKIHEFWTRKEIADIHYKQGQLNMAINELLQIAKEQKAGGYPRICFTYDLLSGLYNAGTNYNKALYYSLEAIKSVSTTADSAYLPFFYERVAYNYRRTGSIAEAIEWNLKTLNLRVALKRTAGIFSIMYDVIGELITLGRAGEALAMILAKSRTFVPEGNWEKTCLLLSLAQCYAALNKNAMAEKYCEELIKLHELRIKRKEISSNMLLNQFLASFYFNDGQYGKAEKYFKKTVDDWPKSDRVPRILYKSHFLFRLDSAKGNYLSAIKHLQTYKEITDSVLTATKTKQIEEIKIAYQTEQKDQLINFKEENIQLLTKQDQLQKSKLLQGAILRNISFAVAALLIIIMALLYNRYRLKQRTNKKLESQQGEITMQNISLHRLVNEKDWLLKEIHHRVKNNLQIVMSLLNSQSAYIDNEPALTAIHDSQHRVHAMSLIHQKLYNSENLSSIDMSLYIHELVSYLSDSFNTGRRIRFEFSLEPLEMDVSQAIPLGLVLNEAITNAIKYAFPGGRDGLIAISLSGTAPHHYLLNISDNGIGILPPLKNKKPGSLGMSLMKGLSEDLDGHFSIENNNGTTIKISFKHDPDIHRHESLF